MGREKAVSPWADPAARELAPLLALKRETAAAGLSAHQAQGRQRAERLVVYAAMLRELARRTGETETLSKAASAAARAARETDGETRVAARLEQAAVARLSAQLFGDRDGMAAAEDHLEGLNSVGAVALRAALEASRSLAAADVDKALQAADALDAAVAKLDADSPEAAALRCDRADFLIGFGVRLKDKALLVRAQTDMADLVATLDPAYLPLSCARADLLRAMALASIGDLSGEARPLADAVKILAEAAEQVDFDHSPLDRGRISHTLALTLCALAEAADDDGLYDHALAAFDQALVVLEPAIGVALRPVAAFDRAACVARRAERHGDAAALARAESAFRAELATRDAGADPVAWAVTQLALTRVYAAQAELLGGEAPPAEAAMALTEAMDVFAERGLKSLGDAAHAALERLKAAAAKA